MIANVTTLNTNRIGNGGENARDEETDHPPVAPFFPELA